MKLPLTDEELLEFVENQDKVFNIDIVNDEFDNKTSLIYISNLNIKCNCLFNDSNKKLDFIKEYLLSSRIVSIENIEKMVIKVILYSIGYKLKDFEADITEEECEKFIKDNEELVSKLQTFLDSLVIYGISTYVQEDKKKDFMKDIETIDDAEYIGLNVVNLLKYQELSFYYVFRDIGEQYNFVKQFNDYIFDGKNLFYHFNNDNNMLIKMIPLMLGE